jgi:hypothetical protein
VPYPLESDETESERLERTTGATTGKATTVPTTERND